MRSKTPTRHRPAARRALSLGVRASASLAALACLSAPAHAVALPVDISPSQVTWALLAAMGLLALVVAALMFRARRAGDAPDGGGMAGIGGDQDTGQSSTHFVGSVSGPPGERGTPPVGVDDATPPADFKATLPAAIRTRRPAASGAQGAPRPVPPSGQGVNEEVPEAPPAPTASYVPSAAAADARPLRDGQPPGDPTRGIDGRALALAIRDDARDATPAPATEDPGQADAAAAPPQFLALAHVDLSIDVLRRHVAAERRPMPAVWVMLLDLCRTHGREHTFREISAEFHERFNVCAPDWDEYPPDRSQPGLEAYPRIVKDLTATWGTHECRRLLDRLLYDNRNGGRRGFTMNAYNDLIALRRAADTVLDTIEQDFAEESKVRDAYARIAPSLDADDASAEMPHGSPLMRDLESQLDSDLRHGDESKSALEREHPAFAEVLVREWANAGLAARLCEMLSRGGDGAGRLSREAAEDLELLRAMARRLAEVNHLPLAVD